MDDNFIKSTVNLSLLFVWDNLHNCDHGNMKMVLSDVFQIKIIHDRAKYSIVRISVAIKTNMPENIR